MTDAAATLREAALARQLEAGCAALALALEARQQKQLLDFLALLGQWNQVYNLTAVRDPAGMLTHHVLDSLSALAPLQRQLQAMARQGDGDSGTAAGQRRRLLDVGSGGGLPGVVFAIGCPDLDVTCVDAVAKKAAFVQQVAATLRLPNLRGVHARVEKLAGQVPPFDVISSRAFAALPDFVNGSASVLAERGVWLAMKGKPPDDEMAALPPGRAEVFHVEQLRVPGLDARRCIVWMRPAGAGV
ncbi:MAG: 16S rRNA (guanine(527)-N(7))-methyltransferase RsmG [Burkholderiaceae bacterium]|jgi:16S rRNA (guanine527-N7)-methyltransferase|nr:16S rRNA (guanine(527)-N(7))-methyltransferase RsmG [Burkholderiaceae bacterium]